MVVLELSLLDLILLTLLDPLILKVSPDLADKDFLAAFRNLVFINGERFGSLAIFGEYWMPGASFLGVKDSLFCFLTLS